MSKLENGLALEKGIIYFLLGLIIVLFHGELVNYLDLVIGIMLVVISLEDLIMDYRNKMWYEKHNRIPIHVVKLVLGFILLMELQSELEIVCIIWGGLTLSDFGEDQSGYLYRYHAEGEKPPLLNFTTSMASFILAILLMIDPLAHVALHVIILGVELLLKSLRHFLMHFSPAKLNTMVDNGKIE